MTEQIISFETAKLAKEKGFNINLPQKGYVYNENGVIDTIISSTQISNWNDGKYVNCWSAPTQSLLQKWIRETRGVHIEVGRNASGWYWYMCREDGGTDLGYSIFSGPNDSGCWDCYEQALENALQVQLCFDLPENISEIKHWGLYSEFAIKNHQNTLNQIKDDN